VKSERVEWRLLLKVKRKPQAEQLHFLFYGMDMTTTFAFGEQGPGLPQEEKISTAA
jgi:hypothetical protein